MSDETLPNSARRKFLAGLGAMSTLALAPGVTLVAPAQAEGVTSDVRWGLLIDVNKCQTDCDKCVGACATENGLKSHDRPATDPQWIRKITVKDPTSGNEKSLPVMCQHCANPPCADVCPTGASFKRADGIVLVDRHICIGCRYCMMACPYKARNFVHEDVRGQKPHMPRGKGTVEACTLCVHRIDEGRLPACVESCDNGALVFGDLKDPNSGISKAVAQYGATRIRADLGLDPGVMYQGI